MIASSISRLVQYGIDTGLITEYDRIYTTNRLLELLSLTDFQENTAPAREAANIPLDQTLEELLDYACEHNCITDSPVYRDLFDTKLMGALTPRPSQVIAAFSAFYAVSPKRATDYFYKLCRDSNYIRCGRVQKDQKWKTDTPYGQLDITINLSKPEKDPKAIAAAKSAVQSGYPKCLLCMENEGYAGSFTKPARQNHRIIPITIDEQKWGFQYSPYVYYNEHCIVFNSLHTPMQIDKSTFKKLFDFVEVFPHYFVGSNADLPIVGGSILSHEHFQGGRYDFAMAKAPLEEEVVFKGFETVKAGILKWPMSVIRLSSKDKKELIELGGKILQTWRRYTDQEAFIFADTDGRPHNTITPIARKNGVFFELDLVLRNNITTQEHPLGLYHPHARFHHIKKENIGLIEVMGLAVLPARLKAEMDILADCIMQKKDLRQNKAVQKHAQWAEKWMSQYNDMNSENVKKTIEKEIGKVFLQVLECAGVYKNTPEGRALFRRFIDFV